MTHWANGFSFHLLLLFSPHKPETKVNKEETPLKEKWISLFPTISMEKPLSLLHQWEPSGLEMFSRRREASSVETKSSLGGHAGTHVCPSQRDRALGLKRSGWAPPWKVPAPMVKAPSCRACRQRECGTNVAPMSMRRATINAGVLPIAAEHCHLLQGVQILEATRASRTDAAAVNSRIRDTLLPPWRPLVPPTVKIVKGDIALPLRPSGGAKAAGVRPREGEASLRRKAGPDGTSMAPFSQGMGETWCVFSVYLTIMFFCVFFVVCLHFCLAFFSYANFCIVYDMFDMQVYRWAFVESDWLRINIIPLVKQCQ